MAAVPPSNATPQPIAPENLGGTSSARELAQLQILGEQLQSDIAALPSNTIASSYLTVPAWAVSQRINQLSDVSISNSTIDAASIPNLSGDYLSLRGGAVTGTSTFATALGIGTTSPNYALDVTSGGPLAEFTDNRGNSVEIGGAGDMIETHDTWATGLSMYVNNNNANGAPGVDMYKSRGTGSNPSAVQWCGSYECGDYLGYINFGGYDGSSYGLGAAIYASVDENWTTTSHASHLAIYFTPHDQTTQDEMVQFGGNDGQNNYGTNVLFYWPLNFYDNIWTGVHLAPNGIGGLDISRGDGSTGAVVAVNGSIGIGTTTPWGQLAILLNNNINAGNSNGTLGFVDKRGFPNRATSDSRLHLGRRCNFGRADRGDERRMGDHRFFVAG